MDENRREATCVSLFSGIGGLDHGLSRSGFRHLLLCESDPWRRSVLAARFPGVPVADDVRLVGRGVVGRERSGDDLGGEGLARLDDVDLVAGGSPCQDLSVAGQRRGLHEGERSSLFFEMARVIDAVRPRWVLWENVPGAFSSQGGRDFGAVLGTLADLGYGLGWRVLDSRFFGVPQRRRRVFVVGALADGDPRAAAERAGQVLAVGSRCGRHPATRGEEGEDPSYASSGRAHDGRVAQPLGAHKTNRNDLDNDTYVPVLRPGREVRPMPRIVEQAMSAKWAKGSSGPAGDEVQNLTLSGASVRRLTPTECERLQALPDGWTNPTGDAPDSRRYAGLGDAVTASVAEWIGRRILASDA